MALTKRQKVLVAVFAVGLAALVIDRVWLRPEAASADSPPGPGQQASSQPSLASSSVAPDKPGIAQRLDRLWPNGEPNFSDVRDPFCLPHSWSGVQKAGSRAAGDPATSFAATHRLSAVLLEGQVSYALVGDRLLTVGQEIDGFTLVSVGDRFAVFEGQSSRVVLKLANE